MKPEEAAKYARDKSFKLTANSREEIEAALLHAYEAGLHRHGKTFGEVCDQARARGREEGFKIGKADGYDQGWEERGEEDKHDVREYLRTIEELKNRVAVAEVARGMAEKQLENFRKDLVRQLGGTFNK